jgi:hypothetical protein
MMIVRQQSGGLLRLPNAGTNSRRRKARPFPFWILPQVLAFLITFMMPSRALSGVITLGLSSAAGGVVIGGTSPNYSTGFGNVNGLGVGSPGAGISIVTAGVSGGVIYSTDYNLVITGLVSPHQAQIAVYVSSNFAKPTALILQSCYPSGGCGNGASFTTISTSSVAPTIIVPSPGVANGTFTANLGLFVANADGAGASSGSDSATLTFVATDLSNGKTSTVTLGLNSPSENIQPAVGLTLATAAGGLTVSPGADFSMNFGNVNGIGISPSAGITIVPASGGVIYGTPYLLQPSFSGFASTTGTLSVYVSMNFVHPAILQLQNAAALGGPYTAISNSSASPTSLTTTAATNSSLTRYIGLFVSNVNGAGAFTGSDSATLTYTLTVP